MQTRQTEKFVNSNRHYSLRKLSVGLASVLIGISFLNGTKTTVKADTIADSTKTGEVSKADNLEVAGDSKDLSAFSMHFNRKNGENETAKADTTSDQTMQTGDQAEAKNQENRLVDQINYKLTKNDSADSKEDLGQNKVAPEATKQASTTKSDAEKNIAGSSSLQGTDNQLNNRAEGNSQAQPQNSLKLAKKVLATNLIETNSLAMTNGGFDEATWGKLDVNNWQGFVQDGVYELTNYTGDTSHVIVPNEADFEKAGKSTNGLQVGITSYTVHSIFSQVQTFAFSKTNNQKVKAIESSWSGAFDYGFTLSKFDGSNLDVSNVTDMSSMFSMTPIIDLTSLANWNTSNVIDMNHMFWNTKVGDLTPLTNWNTSKVTDMGSMFYANKISNLTPLANWDVSNVTDMNHMFAINKISDLTPLTNWDTSKVTNMSYMFIHNLISNLTPLTNWDTSKVTDMSFMLAENYDLIDLRPIANWNISSVKNDEGLIAFFYGDNKLNLTNVNNTPLMQGFLKEPDALQSAIFITNNADLVKATIGQDLPDSTNTATRTITFNIPNASPRTVTQVINYKAIAPVQVKFNNQEIVQTYPVKESDWRLDTSKQNDNVIIDGVICFKPVKIPHINGYKARLIKDPVNPAMFLVSFVAVPERLQTNQLNNVQLPQKPVQPEQKPAQLIQTRLADDKQVDQIINHIPYTLMCDNSTFDNTDSFEPDHGDSASLEASSDSTQKDDAAKTQKVNAAKHKKHIVKKRAVKRRRKNAKKYHLKRRLRKHTKRSRHAKKRIIKHRKRALRKFRKYNLKHVKKA